MNDGWRPVTCTASRRKVAFLPMLSTRWTSALLVSARAQAMTMPGNPAPDPRSAQTLACGARSRSCSESAICRVQTTGIVERAIRLVCSCQASSSATKRSRRADVSRETGVRASSAFAVGGKVERFARSRRRAGLAHAAPRLRLRRSRWTCAASSVSAAGVMPSMRVACPMVRGLWALSLWRTSLESPGSVS